MLKRTITYVDYDGVVRTEDHYFNLTEAELTLMEMSETGGYQKRLEKIVQARDVPSLIKVVKDLVDLSYGEKSPDGRRFIKNKELLEEFSQTEAYSQLFMELCTDDEKALKFIIDILPSNISEAVKKKMAEMKEEEEKASSVNLIGHTASDNA